MTYVVTATGTGASTIGSEVLLLGPGLTIHVKEMVVVVTIPFSYENNRL
jgi:hypothetical protein